MHAARHDWLRLARTAAEVPHLPGADRRARMQGFVDAAWDALAPSGISWIGFYLAVPGAQDSERLVLGPRRDKPACSPIGLHGACGQCFLAGKALVVRDVAELGEGYIACDPRDRSELVLPCMEGASVWGVLDADSHDVACFSRDDALAAHAALVSWGLTSGSCQIR